MARLTPNIILIIFCIICITVALFLTTTVKSSHHLIYSQNINSLDIRKEFWRNNKRNFPRNVSEISDKIKKPSLFFDWTPEKSLIPGMVPPHAHIVWCGNGRLTYRHYLTIKSISLILKPDRITLHFEKELEDIDKLRYHQWLQWIKKEEIFFIMQKLSPQQTKICEMTSNFDEKVALILELFKDEGGLYISRNTWLWNFEPKLRLYDFIYGLEENSLNGILMLRGQLLANTKEWRTLFNKSKSLTIDCAQVRHFYNGYENGKCLSLADKSFENLMPMDIWELDNKFGELARILFYGRPEIRKAQPKPNSVVPNIGHMIWIGGGKLDFVFYLSALSVLYIVNVDVLYIHGNQEPVGENWQKIRSNPKVKFITRMPPLQVYGGEIEPYYRALMSDIIRVDLMIKYGGIYTDTDAIWVKGLTDVDKQYDAVASYDWIDWSWPYPDSVNFGLSYGKKGAKFWHVFRDSMHELHNHLHGFTGVMEPYKLLERYPDLIRIDKRLQVICYKFRCHPLWVADYHNETNDHVNSKTIKNWKEDVYAFHWTHPNPPEYANFETLMKSEGMFAEIGKYVLTKAGVI